MPLKSKSDKTEPRHLQWDITYSKWILFSIIYFHLSKPSNQKSEYETIQNKYTPYVLDKNI